VKIVLSSPLTLSFFSYCKLVISLLKYYLVWYRLVAVTITNKLLTVCKLKGNFFTPESSQMLDHKWRPTGYWGCNACYVSFEWNA